MTAIKDAIWQSCELLAKEKQLITIKNIKTKLTILGYEFSPDFDNLDHDITALISEWRITKLNVSRDNSNTFNLYKTLAIPKKDDKLSITILRKKIFTLEYELNKYKHVAYRANKKTKLLEKKLHTIITNSKKERQEFIVELQTMLSR